MMKKVQMLEQILKLPKASLRESVLCTLSL